MKARCCTLGVEAEAGDGLKLRQLGVEGAEMLSRIQFPPHPSSAAVSGVSVSVSHVCVVLGFPADNRQNVMYSYAHALSLSIYKRQQHF